MNNSGKSIVYPSDEWYLTAGRSVPPAEFYDTFDQLEDGVGMWRKYHDTFLEELARPRSLVIPRRLDVVTGTLAAPLITEMAQRAPAEIPRRAGHGSMPSKTAFFGGNVSVAGPCDSHRYHRPVQRQAAEQAAGRCPK